MTAHGLSRSSSAAPPSDLGLAWSSTVASRKRAEQDSILLANRIRLLRAEEEKTRKKTREAEQKTLELVEARRRNEGRRQADEAEKARRLAERQEAELTHFRERANKQSSIAEKQRGILQEKAAVSNLVRQEREAGERLALEEKRLAKLQAQQRYERVRVGELAALESRARSEDSKRGLRQGILQEKLAREDEQHGHLMTQVELMEREEAELMARLQRSQMRHHQAYAQLEDARRGDISLDTPRPPTGSTSSGRTSLPRSFGGTPSSSSARPPQLPGFAGAAGRPPLAARPPPQPTAPGSGSWGLQRSSSEPAFQGRRPAAVAAAAKGHQGGSVAASSCSTACGTEHGEPPGSLSGGDATPPARARGAGSAEPEEPPPQQRHITYTTADGTQLDIAAEEELDLDALFNG